MSSAILQLSELISSSVSTLIKTCDKSGLTFPDLRNVSASVEEGEAFRTSPAAREATDVIIAAALQLVAILAPPNITVLGLATAHFKSAAIRTCLENNVTECLREAGSEGMHVNDIATKCRLNSDKLSRILRVLANDHVYREVTPDVFANTRLSLVMDTKKSLQEIQAEPENKHDGTHGFVAFLEHMSSDAFKASAYIPEVLADPFTSHSGEPIHSPFNRAFNLDIPVWKWYESPEQSFRRKRFAIGMSGLNAIQPPDTIVQFFDWGKLPDGAIVVDVGSGVGTTAVAISKAYPRLKVVIEDLPHVAQLGREFLAKSLPDALESGRIKVQAHDFLSPQPVQNPAIFLVKHIIHNWSDPYAGTILRHLRDAAGPETRLLLADFIVSYACHDPSASSDSPNHIPGSVLRDAPAPLLANYGAVAESGYVLDMTMLTFLNAQERTMGKLRKLLESSGWKIVRVHRGDPPGEFLQPLEAVPI